MTEHSEIDWDRLDGVIEYPEFRPYILGVVERCGMLPVICYDRSAVIDHLTREMGDYETALEWYEFNVVGGYLGPTTPVFLDTSIFGRCS